MKTRTIASAVALIFLAATAFAGLSQPAPVTVDMVNMFASGDQLSARTADDDTSYIGCGIRNYNDGIGSFKFGFCQAADSEGVQLTCFTENASLIDSIEAVSSFAYISFIWRDDGFGGADCIRIGSSTQSFYLLDFATKKKKKKKGSKK